MKYTIATQIPSLTIECEADSEKEAKEIAKDNALKFLLTNTDKIKTKILKENKNE